MLLRSTTLLGILALTSVGCASRSLEEWTRLADHAETSHALKFSGTIELNPAPGPPLKLTTQDLEAYSIVEETSGRLTVRGPTDYAHLVKSLAHSGGEALETAIPELGIETELSLHLVLVPVDVKQWPTRFTFETELENNVLVSPLLIDRETSDLKELLRKNDHAYGSDPLTSGIIGHEFFEASVVLGMGNLRVAPDMEGEWGPLNRKWRHYTRWYRDGFATYGSMVWLNKLYESVGIAPKDRNEVAFLNEAETSLARVGPGIFRWSQFRAKGNQERYEASLGLFLQLDREFGRDQMGAWNRAIAASTDGYKGRADLLEAAEKVFDIDLRDYARRSSAAGKDTLPAPQLRSRSRR